MTPKLFVANQKLPLEIGLGDSSAYLRHSIPASPWKFMSPALSSGLLLLVILSRLLGKSVFTQEKCTRRKVCKRGIVSRRCGGAQLLHAGVGSVCRAGTPRQAAGRPRSAAPPPVNRL